VENLKSIRARFFLDTEKIYDVSSISVSSLLVQKSWTGFEVWCQCREKGSAKHRIARILQLIPLYFGCNAWKVVSKDYSRKFYYYEAMVNVFKHTIHFDWEPINQ